MLQLVDLDIGWGHRLLGFDDFSCLISGLVYGVIIVLLCAYMFHAVIAGGKSLPTTSRWFVAFMNLELVLFVGLMLAKMPKLCAIQDQFMQRLEMDCSLLRFLYVQRACVMVLVGGFCCWVFSSLAYFLSFGFQAIDRPEYAEHLELHDQTAQQGAPARSPLGFGTPPMAAPPQSFARRPVGEAIHVGPRSTVANLTRASGSSSAAAPQRTSYNIPRVSSSITTTATSQSHAEMQHLIKPPVAVF